VAPRRGPDQLLRWLLRAPWASDAALAAAHRTTRSAQELIGAHGGFGIRLGKPILEIGPQVGSFGVTRCWVPSWYQNADLEYVAPVQERELAGGRALSERSKDDHQLRGSMIVRPSAVT
jgi:hypothetical protein